MNATSVRRAEVSADLPAGVLRFRDCEIRPLTREVWRAGVFQPTEPKVFELLLLLVRHRDRVVAKDELFDAIWPDVVVSETVLARSIMKARRAIGDDDRQASIIKTVHRVGYTFTAEVVEAGAGSPSRAPTVGFAEGGRDPSALASAREPRIAVLPVHVVHGTRQDDWMELGLMGLLIRAFEADTRLRCWGAQDLLVTVQQPHIAPTLEARGDAVRRMFGAVDIVAVEVHRGEGLFSVIATVVPATGAPSTERGGGGDVVRAVLDLAPRLAARLAKAPAAGAVGSVDMGDAFANTLFARAMDEADSGRWRRALNLLRIVVEMVPAPPMILRAYHVRALLETDAPDAAREAARLREAVREPSRSPHERWPVLFQLLVFYAGYAGVSQYETALELADEALAVARALADPALEVRALNQYAAVCTQTQRFDQAHTLLVRAMSLGDPVRDPRASAGTANVSGVLAAYREDWLGALAHHQHAHAVVLEFGGLRNRVLTHWNVAEASFNLGLLDAAERHARASLTAAGELGQGKDRIAAELALMLAEVQRFVSMAPFVAIANEVERSKPVARNVKFAAIARGLECARAGDRDACARVLADTMPCADGTLGDARIWLPAELACRLAIDDFDGAEALVVSMERHPMHASTRRTLVARQVLYAHRVHRDGDIARTGTALMRACSSIPASAVQAMVAMDLAWLAAEADDAARCETALACLSGRLESHPLAMLAQARHWAMRGAYDAAVATHERAIAQWERAPVAILDELLVAYHAAARGQAVRHWPALPRLLSAL